MDREELKQLRKRRLRLLVAEFGSQKALAKAAGVDPNYISQVLSQPKKSFAEKAARDIEVAARKPRGWLDVQEADEGTLPRSDWPFAFDRSFWDRLSPEQQREIEDAFQKMVLGASVQDMAAKRPKRKSA